jgi:hypothetical protein
VQAPAVLAEPFEQGEHKFAAAAAAALGIAVPDTGGAAPERELGSRWVAADSRRAAAVAAAESEALPDDWAAAALGIAALDILVADMKVDCREACARCRHCAGFETEAQQGARVGQPTADVEPGMWDASYIPDVEGYRTLGVGFELVAMDLI